MRVHQQCGQTVPGEVERASPARTGKEATMRVLRTVVPGPTAAVAATMRVLRTVVPGPTTAVAATMRVLRAAPCTTEAPWPTATGHVGKVRSGAPWATLRRSAEMQRGADGSAAWEISSWHRPGENGGAWDNSGDCAHQGFARQLGPELNKQKQCAAVAACASTGGPRR